MGVSIDMMVMIRIILRMRMMRMMMMMVMMMMMTTMTTLLRTTRLRNSPERSGEIFDVRDLGASWCFVWVPLSGSILQATGSQWWWSDYSKRGLWICSYGCKLIGMYVIGCCRLCLVMLFMVYAISRGMFMVYGYGYGFGVLVGFPLKKMGRCCWQLDALWLGLEINVFVGAGFSGWSPS